MGFLAPFFALAGCFVAAFPLVLHMLRRAPTRRMPFSLVRFLSPTHSTFTRRTTIEHWPLLLLRILALVLIGLAFARPFHRSAAWSASRRAFSRSVTLLIDRSASMRRVGIRDAVRQRIRSVVDALDETDRLRVAVYSASVETVIDEESWAAFSAGERAHAVDRLISEYSPGWDDTRSGSALQQVADDLVQESRPDSTQEIALITDFQEGSRFDSLQTDSWPETVAVTLHLVRPDRSGNASLHTFMDRRTSREYFRVSNGADSAVTKFRLQALDSAGFPVGDANPIEVLPGRQISIPASDLGLSSHAHSVELLGDHHSFDNRVALPVTQPPVSRIAHAGSTDVNDPDRMRYYLQRALDGLTMKTDEAEFGLEIIDVIGDDGIVLPIPDDVDLAILTDAIPSNLIPSLKKLLRRGGLVVAALHSESMAHSIRELLPVGVTVREASVVEYAMFGRIDFEHSLFADFSDARFADFSSIRFWKHREIEFAAPETVSAAEKYPSPWNVIARFDSGLPAIVRIREPSAGSAEGQLYLLASGWHPDDSQWALSTRFLPMVARFLRLASSEQMEHRHHRVGDSIDPAALTGSPEWELRFPDGTLLTSDDGLGKDESPDLITLRDPGRYTLKGHSEEEPAAVTVLTEIDPQESRTAPLPVGQLHTLGLTGQDAANAAGTGAPAATPQQATAGQLESQQKYWRWFLLAGLSCLVAEAVLSAVIHRRQPETA